MRTLLALIALAALTTVAHAEEYVVIENDAANVSVQLTLTDVACVDGVEKAANYAIGSGAELQVNPTQRNSSACEWTNTTQEGRWQVMVQATRDDGYAQVLGYLKGNGKNQLRWIATEQDSPYMVLAVGRTVGTLNLSVVQLKTTNSERALLATRD
jgi:hypothetical protein